MSSLVRIAVRLLGLVFSPLDQTLGWLTRRPLELVAGVALVMVGALGASLIGFYNGRPDASTGWLLGIMLIGSALGGIYLLTPLGTARFGHEFIRTWFRGMAGVAAAVALAFLSAAASVTDATQSNHDMTLVAWAAAVALVTALLSLRKADA